MSRTITEANLGAWLFKSDPTSSSDLPAAVAGGSGVITRRCVVPGYRSAMMRPGDPVLLWVSGNGRLMARGIWGVGQLTGQVCGEDLSVAMEIPLFAAAVSDADLRAAGVADLEVQRFPAGSNPSWVSKDQLRRVAPLLPRGSEAARAGRNDTGQAP